MIRMGVVVYSGVDYEKILREAEEEADVIVWDGGNNEIPFFKSDIHIVVFDRHRAGHETTYHPNETNLLLADVAIINKVDSAVPEQVEEVRQAIVKNNPKARIILANSVLTAKDPEQIRGKKVLVIEDGPTLTHGGMGYGPVSSQPGGSALHSWLTLATLFKGFAQGSLRKVSSHRFTPAGGWIRHSANEGAGGNNQPGCL